MAKFYILPPSKDPRNLQKTRGKKAVPNKLNKEVGVMIKKFRLVAKLTQEQLAKKIGLTYQQIFKYEHGLNNICMGRLETLATALDKKPSDFFQTERKTETFGFISGGDERIERNLRIIAELIAKCTNQEHIRVVIEFLKESVGRSRD